MTFPNSKVIPEAHMVISSLVFNPPVIAHRGNCAEAPENTLASLMLARAQNAPWVECDVKITSDGVPILMHDDTLDRTTDGHGKVADAMWAEVKTLDAGGWFNPRFRGERVPHLTEALRLVLDSGMRLNLELKPCPGRAKATTMVALIEASKWWAPEHAPPLLSSFSEDALMSAMQLQPQWPRSFAFDKMDQDWRGAAERIEAQALTVDEGILNRETLRSLKQTNLPILAYTVNDPARAKELINAGVSAVFSNNPHALIKVL